MRALSSDILWMVFLVCGCVQCEPPLELLPPAAQEPDFTYATFLARAGGAFPSAPPEAYPLSDQAQIVPPTPPQPRHTVTDLPRHSHYDSQEQVVYQFEDVQRARYEIPESPPVVYEPPKSAYQPPRAHSSAYGAFASRRDPYSYGQAESPVVIYNEPRPVYATPKKHFPPPTVFVPLKTTVPSPTSYNPPSYKSQSVFIPSRPQPMQVSQTTYGRSRTDPPAYRLPQTFQKHSVPPTVYVPPQHEVSLESPRIPQQPPRRGFEPPRNHPPSAPPTIYGPPRTESPPPPPTEYGPPKTNPPPPPPTVYGPPRTNPPPKVYGPPMSNPPPPPPTVYGPPKHARPETTYGPPKRVPAYSSGNVPSSPVPPARSSTNSIPDSPGPSSVYGPPKNTYAPAPPPPVYPTSQIPLSPPPPPTVYELPRAHPELPSQNYRVPSADSHVYIPPSEHPPPPPGPTYAVPARTSSPAVTKVPGYSYASPDPQLPRVTYEAPPIAPSRVTPDYRLNPEGLRSASNVGVTKSIIQTLTNTLFPPEKTRAVYFTTEYPTQHVL